MGGPRRQHVVSQVVLRRWAQPPGRLLAVLDLRTGLVRRKGPGGVGWEPHFIKHGAQHLELRWKDVEDRLPAAFDMIDSGTSVPPERVAATIRECVALHWARSRAVQAASRQIYQRVLASHLQQLAWQPQILDAAFQQSTGLIPAGPEARQIALDKLAEGPRQIRDGRFFSHRVPYYFQRACEVLRSARVEIIDVPAPSELILGDCPVLTLGSDLDAVGPHQGVALCDARHVVMPLGPAVAVAFDRQRDARGEGSAELIRSLNRAQVQGALHQVVFRIGSAAEADVRSWLTAALREQPSWPEQHASTPRTRHE